MTEEETPAKTILVVEDDELIGAFLADYFGIVIQGVGVNTQPGNADVPLPGFLLLVKSHSFLLVGLIMVTILIPLTVTANKRSQRLLGKYWKTLQRATYIVWGLLALHLALLSGLLPAL